MKYRHAASRKCFHRSSQNCIHTFDIYHHGNNNTEMLSIKILLNIASSNHYLDTLAVMIPEMMLLAMCCERLILNK